MEPPYIFPFNNGQFSFVHSLLLPVHFNLPGIKDFFPKSEETIISLMAVTFIFRVGQVNVCI
nr:MAG TPA: hypothetical protein [Caudoviricetes sp.]DAX25716.1 MAG TPA: hypothetical protein [Caudoviricetes sp.]